MSARKKPPNLRVNLIQAFFKKPWRFPLIGAVLLFTGLWKLDFPQPTYDDLFYTGAAMHLAGGGDFSNPLLDRQEFPSHYFYVYPPLHSFMLAAWLKIFGISAVSLTGFQMLAIFIISAATMALLREHGSPLWMEWLVLPAVCFSLFPLGLRPEAPGTMLIISGFAFARRNALSAPWLLAGNLLMMAGAVCAPRTAFFAVSLFLCAGYLSWRGNGRGKIPLATLCVLAVAAAAMTGLIFLVLIDFRVTEFLHTFHFHSTRVAGKQFEVLKDFAVHTLGIFQWPLLLLPLGLLLWIISRRKDDLAIIGIFLAAGFVLTVLAGAIGHGVMWWVGLTMLVLAGSYATRNAGIKTTVLQVTMVAILLVANRKLIANCYGLLSGNIAMDAGDQVAAMRAMRPTAEHPLLLDSAAARYLFDYRIPAGALDLCFGTVFPGTLPGDLNSNELRKGDVFLSGPVTLPILINRTYLEQITPKWRAFGLAALTFEKYPRRIHVISAESCQGTRPRSGEAIWLPK